MLIVLALSDKPCFICHRRENTAEVRFKDGTFTGVLCRDHAWERLKPPTKKANEARDAQGG